MKDAPLYEEGREGRDGTSHVTLPGPAPSGDWLALTPPLWTKTNPTATIRQTAHESWR